MKQASYSLSRRRQARNLALALSLTIPSVSFAAPMTPTDIDNAPVVTTTAAQAKPNVMLLMDASDSMARTHMPDEMESVAGPTSIGYKTAACNVQYYDPNKIYVVPKDENGNPFPSPTFSAAPYSGFASKLVAPTPLQSSSTDLSQWFVAYDNTSLEIPRAYVDGGFVPVPTPYVPTAGHYPGVPAYYYVYTPPGAGPADVLRYDSAACALSDPGTSYVAPIATAAGGTWKRVIVSATSGSATVGADERTNFATWYSFYRNRLSLIKSAASLAFTPLGNTYRVGFLTVEPKASRTIQDVNPNRYLPIADFDATNRVAWFRKLFSQTPGGASPAREGLARVGRYYAGKSDSINSKMNTGLSVNGIPDTDPVQFACQQNFTIMTTDGYWNAHTETNTGLGGPVQLDGTNWVDQQDGLDKCTWLDPACARPIYDGVSSGTEVDTNKVSTYISSPCAVGGYQQTTQHSTSTVNKFTKSSVATQKRTVSYTLSSQQAEAQTSLTSRFDTQNTQTKKRDFTEERFVVQETFEVLKRVEHTQITTQQYKRSAAQIVARSFEVHEKVLNYQKTVNQWQKSSQQYWETTTQWQEGTNQYKYGAVQWLRITYQVNVPDSTGENFTVPSPERCIVAGTALTGSTPTSVSCADVVSYGGNGPASNPGGDGNSSAMRYDNSSTCANLVAGGAGSWNAGVYSVVDSTSPYTHTDCMPGPATAAYAPVLSCPLATAPANVANSWTATTCDQFPTPAAPIAACTFGPGSHTGANQVVTTCTQTLNSATGVASCTYGTSPHVDSSFVTVTCSQPGATNFAMGPSLPCSPADGVAHTDPSFVTTTCVKALDNVVTTVPSCVANLGLSSANGYQVVTCSALNTASDTVVSAATCLADSTANGGLTADGTSSITCTQVAAGPDAAGNVPVPSCPVAGGGFEYACVAGPLDQPVAVAVDASSCPAGVGIQPGGGVDPYVTYTCSTPAGVNNIPLVPPTYIDPASCNNGTSGTFVTTTCTNVPVSPDMAVDPATCPLGVTVGADANHYVQICTKHLLSGPTPTDPALCVYVTPSAGNGWQTSDCTIQFANTTPVLWGSCVPGAIVTHIGPGDDIVCEEEDLPPTFVTVCTPTGAGDDGTAAHWNVACSGPVVVASPPVAPSPTGIVGAHNVDPATCTDGAVGAGNIVAHCSTSSAGTLYPTLTPVPSCHPGFDAAGTYGPAGTFWDCQSPPGTNFGPSPVAANDPACLLNSTGVPQTGPGEITTTCTGSDDAGMVAGFPNYVTAASCAAAAASPPLGATITCTTVPLTDVPADPVTCSAGTTSAGYPFDLITACSGPIPVPPVTIGACTAATATGPNFQSTTCGLTAPVTTSQPSCTPTYSAPGVPGPDPGTGDYTTCSPNASGVQFAVDTTTTVTTINTVNGVVGAPSTTTTPVTTAGDGVCYANAASFPPLVQPTPPVGCGAWPCKVLTAATGGSSNSLADVAQYYYQTDLRPAGNPSGIVSNGSVHTAGVGVEGDTATYVHMTTFVVGLGVSGTLNYDPNYKSGAGDFTGLRSGAKVWPVWPDPAAGPHAANGNFTNQDDWNNPRSIDDYWHTAVNGRGTYFSATDPSSVVLGLGTALSTVHAVTGAGSAAAVSSLQPVPGNNFAYSTGYVTNAWTGDVRAFLIDTTTGTTGATHEWSATAKLNSLVSNACDNRNIYLLDQLNPSAVNGLVNFTWNTSKCDASGNPLAAGPDGLTTTAETDPLAVDPYIKSLSQYFNMTAAQKAAATSPALVNYLRGQQGNEIVATSATQLFRARSGVLGDIVGSQPVYVQKPFANYLDTGYSNFLTTWASRTPMVYVGGNDGMLHAFDAVINPPLPAPPIDAQAGMEKWAVIPSTVLPNMYRLADTAYVAPANHRFFVDGTPVAGDIDIDGGGHWRTILVGGLNAGGKGYYAIDVTDPSVLPPKALWEFKQDATQCPSPAAGPYVSVFTGDCNLGLTFGKPVITKLASRWVVMFTSGYNNNDGLGYLYVVDAYTGHLIQKIATTAPSPGVDSGLAQINNYVNNALIDNTTVRAYGGDLLGRIWRFDFGGAGSAQLIGTTEDSGGTAEPITIRPELAELNGKPMVFVGTGKLLGTTDVTNTNRQSVYGVVDPLTTSGGAIYSPDLRTSLNQLKMTQIGSGAGAVRTVACATAGTCTHSGGWVVDFPDAVLAPTERGERVNVDMKLVLGTLVVASNVPSNDVCTVGGHSWYNYLNFSDGQAVNGASLSNPGNVNSARIVSEYLSDSIVVGFNVLQLPPAPGTSNPRFVTGLRTSDGSTYNRNLPVSPPPFQGKRISWREIAQP
jgi:Tfp pilus tip-associated adhesin PilY1